MCYAPANNQPGFILHTEKSSFSSPKSCCLYMTQQDWAATLKRRPTVDLTSPTPLFSCPDFIANNFRSDSRMPWFLSISRKHKFPIETTKVISLYSKFCVLSSRVPFPIVVVGRFACSHRSALSSSRNGDHDPSLSSWLGLPIWKFRLLNIYKPLLLCMYVYFY
jgi:hypothetical protein